MQPRTELVPSSRMPSAVQVRHELEQGHSVRYLTPASVVRYIYDHGLYGTAAAGQRPRWLHPGSQKVDTERD